jgi:hypothetical protein
VTYEGICKADASFGLEGGTTLPSFEVHVESGFTFYKA